MRIFFILFNLCMTAIITYAGVGIGYDLIFPDVKAHVDKSFFTKTTSDGKQSFEEKQEIENLSDYSVVYNKNLFGTLVSKVETKPDIDISHLEQTTLKLKLLGTVVGYDINYAVILADNSQGLYRENENIKDAKIKRIYRQKVVLTRNGRDEILEIEQEQGQKKTYYDSLDDSINQKGANQYNISRNFIDESLNDINSLMRQARVKPHFENGNPDGIKIESIRPMSLFKKMGLENGDVLVGANGNDIKTVNDAIGLYNNLKSANKISLQIKRGGQEQTLEYNIN